ncbi:hypothetical protein C8R46DRAFT_1047659 [Mycena filopes]|nr:hypothetical protein C8R46DRAFT_1047659 [Mycena filopes]
MAGCGSVRQGISQTGAYGRAVSTSKAVGAALLGPIRPWYLGARSALGPRERSASRFRRSVRFWLGLRSRSPRGSVLSVRRANTQLGIEPMFKTTASTSRRPLELEVFGGCLVQGFRDASTQIELNFNLSLRGPGSTDWFKLCRRPLHSNHSVVTDLVFHLVRVSETGVGFGIWVLKPTLPGALTSQRIQSKLWAGGQTVGLTVCTGLGYRRHWVDEAMRSRLGGESRLTIWSSCSSPESWTLARVCGSRSPTTPDFGMVQLSARRLASDPSHLHQQEASTWCPPFNPGFGSTILANTQPGSRHRGCHQSRLELGTAVASLRAVRHRFEFPPLLYLLHLSSGGPVPRCWRGHHEAQVHRRREVGVVVVDVVVFPWQPRAVDKCAPVVVLVLGANRRGVPEQRRLLARVFGVVVFCEGLLVGHCGSGRQLFGCRLGMSPMRRASTAAVDGKCCLSLTTSPPPYTEDNGNGGWLVDKFPRITDGLIYPRQNDRWISIRGYPGEADPHVM